MKSNVPNIITCCNLICGCCAVVAALYGSAEVALLMIVLGAAFDFCDGLSARALGVSSPIGKELDSLADCITFGFAPSAMIFYELVVMPFPLQLSGLRDYVPYLAFIMAAFSALRLAKFNLDTRQTTSFIGLPTPANALFWGSLLVSCHQWFENIPYGFAFIIVMMLLSSWLLVCELPMFALKFKHWGLHEPGNMVKYCFIAFSVVVFLASFVGGMALASIAVIILAYILVSFIMWCISKHQ